MIEASLMHAVHPSISRGATWLGKSILYYLENFKPRTSELYQVRYQTDKYFYMLYLVQIKLLFSYCFQIAKKYEYL